MSKVEDLANEIYKGDTPITRLRRKDYCDGYHQAEKNLELTWGDINNIKLVMEQVECDYVEQDKKLYTKDFYEEVLKRFKDFKERKRNEKNNYYM